ncbi:cytochrome P450 [Schizothecium vesticola]|uniref:Cytochrome P450 n=1 Tax=Schizothecium vesticola TaxID=314040 RepID=A0AA40BKJ4_9PEZI|nr:cytochrome P450 [Schizothecium vesticola]
MALVWALYAFQALVLYVVSTVVYRCLFHPLAGIPGPFVPSVTRLYIWYWNVIKDGKFYLQLDELHARYGPVIYSVGGRFYKDPGFYDALNVPVAFTAISNEEHRRRRAPLNHFFSRRAVLDLEDIVQEKAAKLCRRYAFADCWDHLDAPDYNEWFSEAVRDTGVMWWTFQQFPILIGPMALMPMSVARKMSPAMNGWMDCIVRTSEYVAEVQKKDEETPIQATLESLSGEALSFCTAAADNTGNALETAAYYVITNPKIYAALTKELRDAFPDPNASINFVTLEKLPYLTAVIKEGQRLAYGVIGRLPRVTASGGATFNDYYVPEGTVVSMSSWTMHRNPDAFPNPDVFDPTRWTTGDVRAREKCLVTFGRGSRACIGQNLAMCELYDSDRTFVDYFTAFHPKDAKGFKVVEVRK